jgi:hypothetical protein
MKLDNLSKGERFIVDWQYRMLGGFFSSLAEALTRADTVNREKLRRAFPDETQAMIDYKETDGWWENVIKKANLDNNKEEGVM